MDHGPRQDAPAETDPTVRDQRTQPTGPQDARPAPAPRADLTQRHAQLLGLQRSVGNQAVLSLLKAEEQRRGAAVTRHARATTYPKGLQGGHDMVQRVIGNNQVGKTIKHTPSGRTYATRDIRTSTPEDQHYRLEPLDSGDSTIDDVAGTDTDYEVVGNVDGDLSKISDEPTRRLAAGEAAHSLFTQSAELLEAGDFTSALSTLERMETILLESKDVSFSEAMDDRALEKDFETRKLPYWSNIKGLYRECLLSPTRNIYPKMLEAATRRAKPLQILGYDAKAQSKEALAEELTNALDGYRCRPELVPTLLRIVGERKKGVKNDEAKAYDKAVPPLLKDGDFRKSYLGMTESKFRIRHKTKIDIYDAVISEAVVKYTIDDTEARTRAYLLDHLDMKVTIESLKDPVDKILNDGLGTNEKAERLKHLFEDDPLLLKEATENLKTEEPHKTLLAIKSGGKEHSISNINDYVGDKLNDPLMEWVISKKIPVEVHATSVLLSFAKLKVEGFTDIIEIPSSHTGTKKYVAANPESGLAKIVFQTQPGASYAIQTVGQFLFYELYKDLGAREKLTPIEGDFVHKDFKARNLLGVEGKVARYLLVKSGSTTGFIAEIPFVDHPHEITEAGAIHLIGVGGEEVILKGVDVQTLPVDQLKVVNEEVKWDNVYVEALKDAGVEVAEIACIGRKEALKTALKAFGVTPSVNMELPYFNVTVFHLKRDLLGPVVLLAFQISPDFFGDRAGALALALKRIGVKHVTFVGTAGGLAKGLEKGDFVVPKDFANYAEEALGEKMPNEAMGLLPPEKGLKEGGLHVGVHSPITESREMIEELKRLDVSTVDCEAGFIADALRGSGVSLYALYYVSDVPGSQESIGMGGTATTPITTTSVSTVATGPELTERAVLEIVKRVVGRIEASDKKLAKQENPVNRDGTMDVTLEGKKKGKLQLTVSGPELAKGDVVGLLALLGNRLSKLIVSEGGVVTGIVLGLLNTCALEFYRDFRLKVTIGIKTK